MLAAACRVAMALSKMIQRSRTLTDWHSFKKRGRNLTRKQSSIKKSFGFIVSSRNSANSSSHVTWNYCFSFSNISNSVMSFFTNMEYLRHSCPSQARAFLLNSTNLKMFNSRIRFLPIIVPYVCLTLTCCGFPWFWVVSTIWLFLCQFLMVKETYLRTK